MTAKRRQNIDFFHIFEAYGASANGSSARTATPACREQDLRRVLRAREGDLVRGSRRCRRDHAVHPAQRRSDPAHRRRTGQGAAAVAQPRRGGGDRPLRGRSPHSGTRSSATCGSPSCGRSSRAEATRGTDPHRPPAGHHCRRPTGRERSALVPHVRVASPAHRRRIPRSSGTTWSTSIPWSWGGTRTAISSTRSAS